MIRLDALAACLLALAACDGRSGGPAPASSTASSTASPSAWPPLPRDVGALDALVAARTRRAIAPVPALDAATVRAAVAAANDAGTLAVDMPAIVATLNELVAGAAGKRSYLLFGNHHDSALQVEAYRDIVSKLEPAPLEALEQFEADGRWSESGGVSQVGEDGLLRAALAGDRPALDQLSRQQEHRDYTAWKYGYLNRVMDVVVVARSLGRALIGCEMPEALLGASRTALGDRAEILRDVHCGLVLDDALASRAPTMPVALYYGDGHLAPEALARFLPADANVVTIHLLGGRDGQAGIENDLRLQVIEPVLAPLGPTRYVLLLRGKPILAPVSRARDAGTGGKPRLSITADLPTLSEDPKRRELRAADPRGTLIFGGQRYALGDAPVTVDLAGQHASWLLELGERTVVMGVEVPAAGEVRVNAGADDVIGITMPR
jgi:hypothetical protein